MWKAGHPTDATDPILHFLLKYLVLVAVRRPVYTSMVGLGPPKNNKSPSVVRGILLIV